MNLSPSDCASPCHPGDASEKEAEVGGKPSHGISLELPDGDGATQAYRPSLIQHISEPAYHSPLRHHRRTASEHRVVKETLDARSEFTNNKEDGRGEHHINQYLLKEEIGRGSFGAVHIATDQYGKEFAVKEFSKSRLRKRAQSNILRRPHGRGIRRPGHLAAGTGLNSPLHHHSASDIHNEEEKGNPLYLIKEEIAIMKKLNHPNLVSLVEVLDDPEEDSLYMVLEMCKKGVVMKVGLGDRADPYDDESCRCWFRDLILGIEYLHAQGVVHRDIKPDNLLLTEDDVLKIVDFGVSEMFEKASDMRTAKSAGSPAFMPPELCVTKHGNVSGKAADIWSMGISLYCLRFGKIPFERSGVLELYEAIKNDQVDFEPDNEPQFVDLMRKLLEKDPNKRIKMPELREHPWVTKNGSDPLLPEAENTANLIQPPSDIEVNHAITAKMRNLVVMMRAVKKFKGLVERKKKKPNAFIESVGRGVRALRPFSSSSDVTSPEPAIHTSNIVDTSNLRNIEQPLATERDHRRIDVPLPSQAQDSSITEPAHPTFDGAADRNSQIDPQLDQPKERANKSTVPEIGHLEVHDKGHAHDPMDEEPLFLGIGLGGDDSLEAPQQDLIAESPTAAEFSIYDTAYQQEVERIRAAQGAAATVYLTRRVDSKKEYKADDNMMKAPKGSEVEGKPLQGFKARLDEAREQKPESSTPDSLKPGKGDAKGRSLSDIATRAIENTKLKGRELSDRGNAALDNALQRAVDKRKERADRKEAEHEG